MERRSCQVKHDPPNSYGDCIRACIAALIDRDDVPHYFDGRPNEQAWQQLRGYLAFHGKTLTLLPIDDHAEFMVANNPGIPYLLLCSTGEGDHAVICRDGKKIIDPAFGPLPIAGPHSLGAYFIGIVGDLR